MCVTLIRIDSQVPRAHRIQFQLQVGAKVLFDGSQAVPHMPIDVQATGADFLVGTAHKLCGPTGIGFLWGRCATLWGLLVAEVTNPLQGTVDMELKDSL